MKVNYFVASGISIQALINALDGGTTVDNSALIHSCQDEFRLEQRTKKYYVNRDGTDVYSIGKDGTKIPYKIILNNRGIYVLEKHPSIAVYRLVGSAWCIKPEGATVIHHIVNRGVGPKASNLIWLTKEQHNFIHRKHKNKSV